MAGDVNGEEAPDNFEQAVKRQTLAACGYGSEGELNAAVEEAFPGYLAAHAEREAEEAAYIAALPGRMQEIAVVVTAQLHADGMLPDGFRLGFAIEEPIEVAYATDQPSHPLTPDTPVLTEEQKQAAVEAANAQIERWRRQWGTVVEGGPSNEFLADLADPIRLEPRAVPFRDKPRTWDYPVGG